MASSEILVRIRLDGREAFPAELVKRAIDRVDRAIHDTEKEDLDRLLSALRQVPAVAKDAVRYRFSQYPPTAFLIEAMRPGSLIIGGAVAGVAAWILHETLGETLKQAWKKSGLHKRLVKLLGGGQRTKARRIARKLKETPAQLWPAEAKSVVPTVSVYKSGRDTIIFVTINAQSIRVAPNHAAIWREWNSASGRERRGKAFTVRHRSKKSGSNVLSSQLPVDDDMS